MELITDSVKYDSSANCYTVYVSRPKESFPAEGLVLGLLFGSVIVIGALFILRKFIQNFKTNKKSNK